MASTTLTTSGPPPSGGASACPLFPLGPCNNQYSAAAPGDHRRGDLCRHPVDEDLRLAVCCTIGRTMSRRHNGLKQLMARIAEEAGGHARVEAFVREWTTPIQGRHY